MCLGFAFLAILGICTRLVCLSDTDSQVHVRSATESALTVPFWPLSFRRCLVTEKGISSVLVTV